MLAVLTQLFPLACDGCFKGYPAWIGLGLLVLALIGGIYMLLWSNLGARLAYLVVMVSLMIFMIILSSLWIVGAPGTTTSTGPRGREPGWVPFLPGSEFAQDFEDVLGTFPDGPGWEPTGTIFPGAVDTNGEFEAVRAIISESLGHLAAVQGLDATSASDWSFRDGSRPPLTPAEEDPDVFAPSVVRFNQAAGTKLIVAIEMPATSKHRSVTVMAYRDKGLVFLPGLMFLLVSIAMLVLHTWLLAKYEEEEKALEAAMAPSAEPVTA